MTQRYMNKRYFITLAIVFTLSVIAIGGAYMFHTKTIEIESELSSLHNEVQTLSIQANRVISLRQVATATGDDLEKLQVFFVAKDGALDFVKYIEGLAVSSGLTFSIDTVDEYADPALVPYDKTLLKMSVRTTGTKTRIRAFLSLIESLPYNVKIQRLDLRKAGENWTMVVDVGVVKQKDK
jgi:Tfp pilus assembly protein PilO